MLRISSYTCITKYGSGPPAYVSTITCTYIRQISIYISCKQYCIIYTDVLTLMLQMTQADSSWGWFGDQGPSGLRTMGLLACSYYLLHMTVATLL